MKYEVVGIIVVIIFFIWIRFRLNKNKYINRRLDKIYTSLLNTCKKDKEFKKLELSIEKEFYSYDYLKLNKFERLKLLEKIVYTYTNF